MKYYLPLVVLLLVLACQSEQDAGPANQSTFIRFYGTADNNEAVLALESVDGYAFVSNAVLQTGPNDRKISLIKTDFYGNLLWERTYPNTEADWLASSFLDMTGAEFANPGYLIIGDSIKGNIEVTDLLLFKTDPEGNMEDVVTLSFSDNGISYPLHGRAVTVDNQGNFVVLGSIDNHPTLDMYVAKLSATNMEVMWDRTYGAGESETVRKIYYDESNKLWWGGSFRDPLSQNYAVRLINAAENAESSETSATLGNPGSDEEAFDFCRLNGGWAITGKTNVAGDDDILVLRVNDNSQVMFSTRLENTGPDVGVSIARTEGNGMVVLGTVTTENREDLSIVRIDPAGNVLWQYNYGGSDRQEGASIRVTSDGSYLVFATTWIVSEAKLMIMKLNKEGKLY